VHAASNSHALFAIISKLSLPLNLRGNERHSFHPVLSGIRKNHRHRANSLPIWSRLG